MSFAPPLRRKENPSIPHGRELESSETGKAGGKALWASADRRAKEGLPRPRGAALREEGLHRVDDVALARPAVSEAMLFGRGSLESHI